jgi:uncharacterized protein YwgA
VNAGIRQAANDPSIPGHIPAQCIMRHRHFKVLYERIPQDVRVHSSPGEVIARAAVKEFGAQAIRYSQPKIKQVGNIFPVCGRDGRIEPAIAVSEVLTNLRPTSMEFVFVDPELQVKSKIGSERIGRLFWKTPRSKRMKTMKQSHRAAVIALLNREMLHNGSWCGETHIQKAMFLLQDLLGVDTGFDFILYRHGPFSFELRDELAAMQADGLLELVLRQPGYGPTYVPTQFSEEYSKGFPKRRSDTARRLSSLRTSSSRRGLQNLRDWQPRTSLPIEKEFAMQRYVQRGSWS